MYKQKIPSASITSIFPQAGSIATGNATQKNGLSFSAGSSGAQAHLGEDPRRNATGFSHSAESSFPVDKFQAKKKQVSGEGVGSRASFQEDQQTKQQAKFSSTQESQSLIPNLPSTPVEITSNVNSHSEPKTFPEKNIAYIPTNPIQNKQHHAGELGVQSASVPFIDTQSPQVNIPQIHNIAPAFPNNLSNQLVQDPWGTRASGLSTSLGGGRPSSDQTQNADPYPLAPKSFDPVEQTRQMAQAFEDIVKNKLSKVDELIIALTEKQESQQKMSNGVSTQSLKSNNSIINAIINPEVSGEAYPRVSGEAYPRVSGEARTQGSDDGLKTLTGKKTTRNKKTYYNITDSMWGDIRTKYSELPEGYRGKTFSDGEIFYVEHKNKKIVLDGKGLLKILNSK